MQRVGGVPPDRPVQVAPPHRPLRLPSALDVLSPLGARPLVETVLRAATSPDGTVDWTRIRSAASSLGLETGGCALAETVARLSSTPAPTPGVAMQAVTTGAPDPASLRAGLAELEYAIWGGRRFSTSAGVL
jgi:hypothetical protein